MKPRIARSCSPELLGFAAATLLLSAGSAPAAVVNLTASQGTITIPATGEVVTMWGYGPNGSPQVPGAPIVVPPGDTTLTVNLTNYRPEPTSVVISTSTCPALPRHESISFLNTMSLGALEPYFNIILL